MFVPKSIPTFTFLIVAAAVFAPAADVSPARRVPTVDDLLRVRQVRGSEISPDGRFVAFGVNEADFEQDAYVTRLWLARADGSEPPFALTAAGHSATNPQWSPDGRWLAFTSNRAGEKDQLFVIAPEGGEALPLTRAESAVSAYAWSRDGRTIAFTADEPEASSLKDRKRELGDYEVVRKEYRHRHLFTLDLAEARKAPTAGRQRTRGHDFSVTDFAWSPDGSLLAFSATRNPDLVQGVTADLFLLKLADDTVTRLVSQPGPDTDPCFSPDGTTIAFASAMGKTRYFARNQRIAVVPVTGGTPRSLTDTFDEDANPQVWNAGGIYFTALQKTTAHLFRLDPGTAALKRVSSPAELILSSVSLSADGRLVAYAAPSPNSLAEVFVSALEPFAPRRLTDMTAQAAPLVAGTREVVSWKSRDGTEVEGVLIKPADFDPGRRYPLLCVIHGGPTGVDRPTLLDTRYYPTDIWAGRGALVLKVNYRGSAGYGEKFRELNYRNLGVGDAWDVLSGIDSLLARGIVDPKRIGCMGWSQGGYISAFLTTSSDRFAAISVGAGISNWSTYYYNTDITPFTIQYLGEDPAEDPEVYRTTSPMTAVKKARTPTLIQHGENDRRVPIANAYELRQGLEDRGVPVEMVVYKGFGHGITKPKAMRAVMEHNLAWFGHHLWGDPAPDWIAPRPVREGRP